MPCTYCQVSFSILKWKNKCNTCMCNFCTNCIIDKRCLACHHVLDSKLQYDGLMKVKVKDLKLYSSTRGLPVGSCKEKNELVNMILQNAYPKQQARAFPQSSYSHATVSTQATEINAGMPNPPNYSQTQNAYASAHEYLPNEGDVEGNIQTNQQVSKPQVARPTPSGLQNKILISDLSSIEQIDVLSNRELKQILTDNFVDYKGCVEKAELKKKVQNLYKDRSINKSRQAEEIKEEKSIADEESTCKICWDNPIDCVLLECGHMVTCTSCGKKMNECPICRQYVVRCVHVFRT